MLVRNKFRWVSTKPESELLRPSSSHTAHTSKSAHASHSSHSSSTEEHSEDIVGVNSSAAKSSKIALIPIKVHLARIISLLLFRVTQDSISLCDFFEHFRRLVLLGLRFRSVSIRVVLQGQSFIGFFYCGIICIPINPQNLVIVLLLRLPFLFLCLFYLWLHVRRWVQFFYLVVVHNGCSILTPFHLNFSPSDQWLTVRWVKFQGLVQIVQGFQVILSLHVSQGSVRVDDCIELFVERIQIQSLGIFSFSFSIVSLLNGLIALLF